LSAAERVSPYPIVTFENAALAERNNKLQHQQARAEAKEWLRERGLLASLPEFDPLSESADEFAQRIEQFCGIEPGSALEFNEQLKMITPKIEWISVPIRRGRIWQHFTARSTASSLNVCLK
jgi:hypothetical protein